MINNGNSTVSIIDTQTKNVSTISDNIVSSPEGVAITPDGKYVYVANSSSQVSVISTATNTVVATINT